jgi:hypothetical protein
MKTAMQELKDNSLFTEGEEYIQIVLKKTEWVELFEKENKQIMDSWKEGTKYVMDVNDGKLIPPMSAIDYLIYFKTKKSDYYTSF